MNSAWIVDGLRTPFGRFGGALATLRADDLAALPLAALMRRLPDLDPARIEAAKADHKSALRGRPFANPLTPDIDPPLVPAPEGWNIAAE